jgi:hypothetical protein
MQLKGAASGVQEEVMQGFRCFVPSLPFATLAYPCSARSDFPPLGFSAVC